MSITKLIQNEDKWKTSRIPEWLPTHDEEKLAEDIQEVTFKHEVILLLRVGG